MTFLLKERMYNGEYKNTRGNTQKSREKIVRILPYYDWPALAWTVIYTNYCCKDSQEDTKQIFHKGSIIHFAGPLYTKLHSHICQFQSGLQECVEQNDPEACYMIWKLNLESVNIAMTISKSLISYFLASIIMEEHFRKLSDNKVKSK